MSNFNRRRFLQAAGGLAAAGLASSQNCAVMAQPKAAAKPLKFRLGIVTFNYFGTWTLDEILRMCQTLDIGPVELRTGHKHEVDIALTDKQRAEVKKKFADAGVKFWGMGTACEFQSPNMAVVKKNIELCKQYLDLTHDLGGVGVKVRPNTFPPNVKEADTLKQIGESLIPCGEHAKKLGLFVSVEVHGKGTAEPKNIHQVMQHCKHPDVGLTWNSNPTDIQNGSVAESFKLLKGYIRSCHIHRMYDDPMFSKGGKGTYPYRELFSLLREMGYDQQTQCECGDPGLDPKSGIELMRYYKAMWTHLAQG